MVESEDSPSAIKNSGDAHSHGSGHKRKERFIALFTSLALSFNVVSLLTGITTTFNIGFGNGGPVTLICGWIIVSFFTLMVGLVLAEICAAYPTSGGIYSWSAALAGPNWGPFASWLTGWFLYVGQLSMLSSADFSLAVWIGNTILLSTGTNKGGGYLPNSRVILLIYGSVLFLHALMNSFSVAIVGWMEIFSVVWHIAGTFIIVIVLLSVATVKQNASYVFTEFVYNKDKAEETNASPITGSWGIVIAVATSGIVGFFYILGLTFSIRDPSTVIDVNNEAGGYGPSQIMWDVFNQRYGSGTGGIVLMQIVTVAIFCCGFSILVSSSRILQTLAQDGAVPFSTFWIKTTRNSKIPVNAVWMTAFLAFLISLPSLGSIVAFTAMTSLATIGIFTAYGIPIIFRVTIARKHYLKGPFSLGVFSLPCAIIASLWIITIIFLFCLPTSYPIERINFQYSSVAVTGVFVLSLSAWVFSARHWFQGPMRGKTDSTVNILETQADSQASVHFHGSSDVPRSKPAELIEHPKRTFGVEDRHPTHHQHDV